MDCDLWPVPDEGTCVNGCTIPEDTDEELLAAASALAGTILRTLSGNRVGLCEDVLRPLSECGVCRGFCNCGSGDRIRVLSSVGPVVAVTEVEVDGDIIPSTEWRFYPSSQLLYRVPPDVWPTRDTKWADCGDPDTMCVEVQIGSTPDAWALAVHAELTCELIKSCTGGACRLPSNACPSHSHRRTPKCSSPPSQGGWPRSTPHQQPNQPRSIPPILVTADA
jgi:hypothetical protein